MIQTVTLNSALSKKWVEGTLCTPCAQAACTLCSGRARTAPRPRRHCPQAVRALGPSHVHYTLGAVSQRPGSRVAARLRPCRHPPVEIQKFYHDTEAHVVHLVRRVARAARRVVLARSHIATPCLSSVLLPPCHNTKFRIATHYGQDVRACTACPCAQAGRVAALAGRVTALLRRVVERCWPCRA